MKKYFLATFIVGSIFLIMFLFTLEIIGVGLDLCSICFADSENGWIVGDLGIILHTDDGGKTWEKLNSYPSERLDCVYFVDPLYGWTSGDSGTILHTDDGGKTWKRQETHCSSSLNSIFFLDRKNGWAVGGNIFKGIILHTEDGGNTWKLQKNNADWVELDGVYFLNENKGWVFGGSLFNGAVFITEDGGNSWKKQKTDHPLQDMRFLDDKKGFLTGFRGTFLYTEDGGESWQEKYLDQSGSIKSIFFLDSKYGWTGGSNFLYTEDGGKNWIEKGYSPEFIMDLCFLDIKRGFLLQEKGKIMETTDGGKNFKKVPYERKRSFWFTYIFVSSWLRSFFIFLIICSYVIAFLKIWVFRRSLF